MGTPHVHCMSKLPTAHEPAATPSGARQSFDGQGQNSSVTTIERGGSRQ
jgi:hypothetical protein